MIYLAIAQFWPRLCGCHNNCTSQSMLEYMSFGSMTSDRTVSAYLRRKITIACETCRQRKVRCSGTAPCDLCSKNKLSCVFDTNRQRRGPRRKSIGDGSSQPAIPPSPPKTQATPGLIDGSALREDSEQPPGTVVDSALPEAVVIRRRLQEHFMQHEYQVAEISSNTIIHLLETFFTVSNLQQVPLLPPDHGLTWLLAEDRTMALILALCAVSLAYSSSQIASNGKRLGLARQLQSACRLQILDKGLRRINYLDQFLCYCALACYEASHGDGAQAWCDIGTGQSIVPLISRSDLCPVSWAVLETASDFLSWLRAEFAFGHPQLVPLISAQSKVLSKLDATDPLDDQRADLDKAIELLLRCVEHSSRDIASDLMLPWDRNSKFMSLRLHLEKFSIGIAETYHLDFAAAGSSTVKGSKLAVGISMVLLRDCCSILLNRDFLFTSQPQSKLTGRDLAPEMFLRGRVNTCKASAESIHNLCTQLLSNQIFCLSPFLGYCCFQAAIVLIQSLDYRPTQSERTEYKDKLKVLLAILLALAKFHKPAKLWIDFLSTFGQARNKAAASPDLPHSKASSFFSMFPGIQEPPLVPFQESTEKDITSGQDEVGLLESLTHPVASETAWMDHYRNELRNQVASIAKEGSRATGTSSMMGPSSREINDRRPPSLTDRSIPRVYESTEESLPITPINNGSSMDSPPAGPISTTPTQASRIDWPCRHSETLNIRSDEACTSLEALPNLNDITWGNFGSTLLLNDDNQLPTVAEEINMPDIELPEWDLSSYLSLDNTILDFFHLS